GAQNDLQKANDLANMMVCEYGMSRYKNRVFSRQADAFMSREINEEITAILDACYTRVMEMLHANYAVLERLSNKLYESELIKKADIQKIVSDLNLAAAE
ncbi:MAG: hypothetical protein LBC69_03835, partial [Eubacteriaceae bacterium]|nr:hypothetical protein [Eubacteriaceae bacterium]